MTTRSLSAADSGIQADQTMLDTIGNNIANLDTVGYKQTTAEFSDLLNQQLSPGGGPGPSLASTNPSAIGSGVQVSGIDTDFGEGAITQTGVPSDVAISGSGFFVVQRNGQQYFTRAGDFHLDANGVLATSDGGEVQGWMAGQPTGGAPGTIKIAQGQAVPPQATTTVVIGGNLPSSDVGTTSTVPVTVTAYDSLGNQVPITLTFTPPSASGGSWSLQGTVAGASAPLWNSPQTITFGSDGQISQVDGNAVNGQTTLTVNNLPSNYTWAPGATLSLELPPPGSPTALTQYAGNQSVAYLSQDGHSAGTLDSYSVGADGVITGNFSNGQSAALATIALANFANPGGLSSIGNLSYQASASSGAAAIGVPGVNGTGTLMGGALEQSNVNLASQLTTLVSAQTAYQANAKVVGTTATVLEALVNMP